MSNSHRVIMIINALIVAAAGTACEGVFYTSTTSINYKYETSTTTYDETLPDALEEFFEACHDPLTFAPSETEIDLAGDCASDASGLTSTGALLLYLGLASEDPVSLDGAFPSEVESALNAAYTIEDLLPWPVQNCDITLDLDVDVNGLALTDLVAEWVTRSGLAALHVDLDRDGSLVFAEGDVTGSVDCPNPVNEWAISGFLPSGTYELTLTGVDLDVWISFEPDSGGVSAAAEVDFDIRGITLDPPLSSLIEDNVGDLETILEDYVGIDLNSLSDEISANLETVFADLAAEAEELLEDAVPSGHSVVGIEVDGGDLEMSTRMRVSDDRLGNESMVDTSWLP